MPKKRKFKNPKAKAWYVAAYGLSVWLGERCMANEETIQHILKSVIPSMQRRAEIIERNTKRG